MQPYFNSLLEKIPYSARMNSREYISKNVAVFEPMEHVFDETIYFDYYHFIIFFSDPPLVRIGNKETQFRKESLISFEPGMDVTVLKSNLKLPSKYLSICVNANFFQNVALEAIDKYKPIIKPVEKSYSVRLLEIVRSFELELSSFGEKCDIMVNSISTQIAFQLIRELSNDALNRRNRDCFSTIKYINKAIEYMHAHYNSNIRIDDIAREIYISLAHFERVFKSHTGKTPNQYLINIRLQKAKELLEKDENSIEEIAKSCGFVNISHFSSTFKKILGMPPSKYKLSN